MNIDSLKLSLWNEIASINDETVLQKLKKQIAKLIDNELAETYTEVEFLSDIEKSRKDFNAGKSVKNSELLKRYQNENSLV